MRFYLLACLSVLPCFGTWALVQNPSKITCGNVSSCAITVTSTGAGNLLVGSALIIDTAGNLQSISGGSSVHPANCLATDSGASGSSDVAYILSATGGSTSITFTFNGTFTIGVIQLWEFSYSSGPAVFDLCNNRDQSTNSASPLGVSLTALTGSNDVFIQQGLFVGTVSAVTTYTGNFPNGNGMAYLLNSTNGTAPTWTQSPSGRAALSGIAFTETASKKRGLLLRGVGFWFWPFIWPW